MYHNNNLWIGVILLALGAVIGYLIGKLSMQVVRIKTSWYDKRVRREETLVLMIVHALSYFLTFQDYGWGYEFLFCCCIISCLVIVSYLDYKLNYIPNWLNLFIATIALLHILLHPYQWLYYIMGGCCVSGFLLFIYWLTKGEGIGGGDIKLMAAVGLFLGVRQIVMAFFLGCVLAVMIHGIRMKVQKIGHQVAFAPYLCTGILIAMLYSDILTEWYIRGV